jgi:protein-S-isoprenylcysteine O-methyltransferase Ste14
VNARTWITIGAQAVVFVVLLFGSAGTFKWSAAWVFLALFFSSIVFITGMLARNDPALLAERMKPPIQKGQPLWDKVILLVFIVLFAMWLILMGLDAVRFGWSVMPMWLQGIGAVGFAVSMWISHRTMQENTFLAPVVRIQTERGQRVVSTGPYAVVRHPLYAAALLLLPSTALLLGSWLGLAATIVLAAGLVVRTALEDRKLQRELPGYREYTQRVRHRLIPRIW